MNICNDLDNMTVSMPSIGFPLRRRQRPEHLGNLVVPIRTDANLARLLESGGFWFMERKWKGFLPTPEKSKIKDFAENANYLFPHVKPTLVMVPPTGLEPAAHGLGIHCSIHN
jgi:hypothetical protein